MSHQSGATQSERRRHRRFPCEGFAEVVALRANVFFRGKIKDVSQSGCFVETRARLNLPRSAEVEVRFTVQGQKQSVLARVMIVRPGIGAGFEFLASDPRLGPDFQRTLERLQAAESKAPPDSGSGGCPQQQVPAGQPKQNV